MAEPRPYPQLQRTAGLAPWRPAVSLVLGAAAAGAVIVEAGLVGALLLSAAGRRDDTALLEQGPSGFVFTNLLLAAAIPVTMMAIAAAFHRPPGWLASVQARVRWRWLALAGVVAAVYALVLTGVTVLLEGPPATGGKQAALLIGLCLVSTPLQAAGEEYLIRGWLTQSIGAWFERARLGAVVAGLASATVFALLHGQQDPWLFGDRFAFGLIASWLVWRTGGLEAGIALHTMTNIAAIVPSALEGTLDDALTVTRAPALDVVFDVVSLVVAGLLLAWLAHRRRVPRTGAPEEPSSAG